MRNEEEACGKIQKDIREIMQTRILSDNAFAPQYCIDAAAEWLSSYDDAEYLGCAVNKIGDTVVSLYHHNTIYLIGEAYKTIMYAPKLMFHFVGSKHICIDDVLVKHNNIGNGSIVMMALLRYAKLKNIEKITGFLSHVDDDHKSRRDYYYKKFGFDIVGNGIIKTMQGEESC